MSNATVVKYSDLTTDVARIAFIKDKLHTDDRWVLKGLYTIFQKQTEDEKNVGETVEHNTVGFTGVDGKFLTSLTEQMLKKGFKVENLRQYTLTSFFSDKQAAILKNKMPKYARQLNKIAKGSI